MGKSQDLEEAMETCQAKVTFEHACLYNIQLYTPEFPLTLQLTTPFPVQMDKLDAHVHHLIDSGERPSRNFAWKPMANLLTFVLVLFAFLLKVVSILR